MIGKIFLILLLIIGLVSGGVVELNSKQLKNINSREIIVPYSIEYINSLSEDDYQTLLKSRSDY